MKKNKKKEEEEEKLDKIQPLQKSGKIDLSYSILCYSILFDMVKRKISEKGKRNKSYPLFLFCISRILKPFIQA
jgi:uncharacterized protein with von Willebrand factor type A (vWA) domain